MYANCFNYILEVLRFNQKDLAMKKKDLVEALKFVFEFDISADIINSHPELIKEISKTIMCQSEDNGHKLMRVFNLFIVTSIVDKFYGSTIKYLMDHYYKFMSTQLDGLIVKLKSILDHKKDFTTEYNDKENKIKTCEYQNSIIMFEEVFNHLINLIEEFARFEGTNDNFENNKKIFQGYIQEMCLKYLRLLSLEIYLIKAEIDEFYFHDYIQVCLKALHFFGNLITKYKEGAFTNNSYLFNMSQKIEQDNEKQKNMLVNFVISAMEHIQPTQTKFKIECFSNIKVLFNVYPKEIIDNFKKIATDTFFQNFAKMRYSSSEINKIYFYWISTLKQFVKINQNKQEDTFECDSYYVLFDNVTGILFDETINSNYVLNILNFMMTLFEAFKKKADKKKIENLKRYEDFLANLFNQLTKYLKIVYKDSKELIDCLTSHFKDSTEPEASLNNISKFDKSELIQFIQNRSKDILEEELITRDTFYSKFDNKILIQNSVIVENEHITKLSTFLEDNVVRKLNVVNELITKVFKQYKKIQVLSTVRDTIDHKMTETLHTLYLEYPEFNLLSKVYKYNLRIYEFIITNCKVYDNEKLIESVKFNFLDLIFWVVDLQTNREDNKIHNFAINYRQIYQIIKDNSVDIIKVFKNIYKTTIENYIYYYQVIFGVFGAFDTRVTDSPEKSDNYYTNRAKLVNKAFNEVVILKLIKVLQAEEIEYFDPLYDATFDNRIYALVILKSIYRALKYKIKTMSGSELKEIVDPTIKVILIIVKNVYQKNEIMNYIHLLKIIFTATFKSGDLLVSFTNFCIENDFRFIDFVYSLYTSNLLELKLISIELLLYAPVKIEELIKHQYIHIEDRRKIVRMLVQALDSQENYLSNKALYLIESFYKYFDANTIEMLLNEEISEMFRHTVDFFKNKNHQALVFKKTMTQDPLRIRLTIKSIGKFAEMLAKSRELSIFEYTLKDETKTIKFNLFDENNNLLIKDINFGDYIAVLKKEFRDLRKRPWFNNLYFISPNLLFLCTNKHKKGLEKLFDFVLNYLKQIIICNTEERFWQENYQNGFEVLFHICFFIYPFRFSEKDVNKKIKELEVFKEYVFEFSEAHPRSLEYFLSFFVRNLFAGVELSTEKLDWIFYQFTLDMIKNILKRTNNDSSFYDVLMREYITLLNTTNIYNINAALYFFKDYLMPEFAVDKRMFEAFKRIKNLFLSSYVNLQNFLDFKFSLKINEIYTNLFTNILTFYVENNLADAKFKDIVNTLSNFKVPAIFKARNSYLLKVSETDYEFNNWFTEMHASLQYQYTCVKKRIRDLKNPIEFEFLSQLNCLFVWLKECYKKDRLQLQRNPKTQELILKLIINVLKLNKEYNDLIRGMRGTIYRINKPANDRADQSINQLEERKHWYYYDFFNNIFVDDYDYIVKEFSILVNNAIEVLLYRVLRYDPVQNDRSENLEYRNLKKKVYTCLFDLCFRLESRIFESTINYLSLVKQDNRNDSQNYILGIFNSISESLASDQVNEPCLYVLYRLMKIHIKLEQTIRDKIADYIKSFLSRVNTDNQDGEPKKPIDANDFNKLRLFFRILNIMQPGEKSREFMKDQLVAGLEIEYYLDQQNFNTLSLRNELTEMVNKQSNSKLCEYLVHLFRKDDRMNTHFYYILYDIVKDPKSICYRERMCRENILDRALNEKQNKKGFKWLRFLYKISSKSAYFLSSNSAFSFFQQYSALIQEQRNEPTMLLKENFFFDDYDLFMQIMKNYLIQHPFEKTLNLYIEYFLRCNFYDLKRNINPIIKPFKSERDIVTFFANFLNNLTTLFTENSVSSHKTNTTLNFYLSKISHQYIDYINNPMYASYVRDFVVKISEYFDKINRKTRCEDVISFMHFNILLFKKLQINENDPKYQVAITKLFRYSWNNIAHPKNGNKYLRNVCKLSVALSVNKDHIMNILKDNLLRPLYDTVLNDQEDILDDDSVNIWLESLKNLIPRYKNHDKDWFKDLLAAHEMTTDYYYSNITYSIQNRFWQLIILLRDSFGDNFFDMFKTKFFDDRGLISNITYDILLILLVYIVNNDKKDSVRDYLDHNRKTLIIQKILELYRNEQDSSKIYIEKFYLLLVLYLKLFDDVTLDFTSVISVFVNKDEPVNKTDINVPLKVIKINLQNLTLIYYFLKRNERHKDIKLYCNEVIECLKTNKIIKNVYCYFVFCELFSTVYNLLNMCIKHTDCLPDLLEYANKTLREDNEKKDIFFSVLVYHFVIENLDKFSEITVVNVEYIMDKCLNYLVKKKDNVFKESDIHNDFNYLFELHDDLTYKQDYKILPFYKFFVAVLLKILVISLRNPFKEADFNSVCQIFESIFKNLSFYDIDIKHQAIMLLKCLIVPQAVEEIEWIKFKAPTEITYKQKMQLMSTMKVSSPVSLKESNNKHFKDYLKTFYEIVIAFLKSNSINESIISILKQAVIQNFSIVDKDTRDIIMDAIFNITNGSLFETLKFFSTKVDFKNKKIYSLSYEYLDLYQGLAIYYCRLLQQKAKSAVANLNGNRLPSALLLYDSLLGVLESECLLNVTVEDLVKKLFTDFFTTAPAEEREKLIINVLELLVNDIKLVQYDLFWIIEIISHHYKDFMESDLINNVINKSNKKYIILSKLHNANLLSDKLKMLYYQISTDKRKLISFYLRHQTDN